MRTLKSTLICLTLIEILSKVVLGYMSKCEKNKIISTVALTSVKP